MNGPYLDANKRLREMLTSVSKNPTEDLNKSSRQSMVGIFNTKILNDLRLKYDFLILF